ncbi:MAG: DNA replication and repair protein RecF [Oscillospiraceae bacterium]
MTLLDINVNNFRNINNICFLPDEKLTVIAGKNGQGKTNLLESIWLLTGSKSFRGAKDIELVQKEKTYADIKGKTCGYKKTSNINIIINGINQDQKGRKAKVNDVDYGRATNIAGIFTCVVFAPEHLCLVKGSPDARRRFIDAAICQLYPSYISVLHRYSRSVTQKNAQLKTGILNKSDYAVLDAIDVGLKATGDIINAKRREYLDLLISFATNNYQDISNNKEKLFIRYNTFFNDDDMDLILKKSRNKDIKTGFCTAGPHRADIELFLDDEIAKTYASQGQQRSIALCMKLAEAQCGMKITGEHPVMLLDDVLSELDIDRQSYLLTRLDNKQTIVTACDAASFIKTNGKVYEMNDGTINLRV